MNRTIKLLMFSDIFVVTGFGLIDPILAIFINQNIIGGSIFTAGIAISLFWITKSIVQLPFSRYIDKHGFEKSLQWIIVGTLIMAIVPFFYIFIKSISLIYVAQIIHGIGNGIAYPAWLWLWSKKIDKGHESFEWSLYSTLVSVGTAIGASVGGAITQFTSFKLTFVLVGLVTLIGTIVLLGLTKKHFKPSNN